MEEFTKVEFTEKEVNFIVPDDPENYSNFGKALAATKDGSILAVGAPYKDVDGYPNKGSVYIYDDGDEIEVLRPYDEEENTFFGASVTLSSDGSTLIVGSPGEDNGDGRVYIFERTEEEGYILKEELKSDEGSSEYHSNHFGSSVALSEDGLTLLIGAELELGGDGQIHVFKRGSLNESFTRVEKMTFGPYYWCGHSVALSPDGTVALIGVIYRYSVGDESYSKILTLKWSEEKNEWDIVDELVPDKRENIRNPIALSNDGLTLFVGSMETRFDIETPGEVLVFRRKNYNEKWEYLYCLTPDDGEDGDFFGSSVATNEDGTKLFVGAIYKDCVGKNENGCVYEYAFEFKD